MDIHEKARLANARRRSDIAPDQPRVIIAPPPPAAPPGNAKPVRPAGPIATIIVLLTVAFFIFGFLRQQPRFPLALFLLLVAVFTALLIAAIYSLDIDGVGVRRGLYLLALLIILRLHNLSGSLTSLPAVRPAGITVTLVQNYPLAGAFNFTITETGCQSGTSGSCAPRPGDLDRIYQAMREQRFDRIVTIDLPLPCFDCGQEYIEITVGNRVFRKYRPRVNDTKGQWAHVRRAVSEACLAATAHHWCR